MFILAMVLSRNLKVMHVFSDTSNLCPLCSPVWLMWFQHNLNVMARMQMQSVCIISSVYCVVSVRLLISVWLPTGVILQARCVVAVRQAVRPVGRTPPTASAVKNLSSYTSTNVWRSVLQRTLCGTGSANTAPQPVRSATHSGSAQVLEQCKQE